MASFVFRHFGGTEKLNLFFEMMASFTQACGAALKEINDPRSRGAIKESNWKWWIRELIKIARMHNLDWKVRKDRITNLTDQPSAFVTLVRELQCCIPGPFHPVHRSDDALATAIVRARDAGGSLTERLAQVKDPHHRELDR